MENVIRSPFVLVAAIACSLAGCATMTSGENEPISASGSCTENLTFYAQDSQKKLFMCEQQACGEPLDPSDVLVLEIEDGEAVDAAVATRVGANVRFMEQWYFVDPFVNEAAMNKAKRVFAAKGCNLLIVGDTVKRRVSDPSRPRPDGTQIRWGVFW